MAIKQANALDADQQSHALMRKAAGLARAEAESNAVDVFNTCSWTRTDLVMLPPALAMGGDQVLDSKRKPVVLSASLRANWSLWPRESRHFPPNVTT